MHVGIGSGFPGRTRYRVTFHSTVISEGRGGSPGVPAPAQSSGVRPPPEFRASCASVGRGDSPADARCGRRLHLRALPARQLDLDGTAWGEARLMPTPAVVLCAALLGEVYRCCGSVVLYDMLSVVS